MPSIYCIDTIILDGTDTSYIFYVLLAATSHKINILKIEDFRKLYLFKRLRWQFIFFVPAKASTTRVHAGNNCKPGIASTMSAGKSAHLKPITTNNTITVTTSIIQYTGGVNVKANPRMSEMSAHKRAHRHLGRFHAVVKLLMNFFIMAY